MINCTPFQRGRIPTSLAVIKTANKVNYSQKQKRKPTAHNIRNHNAFIYLCRLCVGALFTRMCNVLNYALYCQFYEH